MTDESSIKGYLYVNPDTSSLEGDGLGLMHLAEAIYSALEEGSASLDLDGSDVKFVNVCGDGLEPDEINVSPVKRVFIFLIQLFLFLWFVVLPFVSIYLIYKLYSHDKWDMRTDCATLYIQGLLKQYGY